VVDIGQGGDFASVSAAIEAAKPGDRILVRPGLYEEALVVDKPLEIIGDGPVKDIEIRANGEEHVLYFHASIGRVANLTLRTVSKGLYGVLISQGRLDLEGCDISSATGSCVYIKDGADPRLRRNVIHDGGEAGVRVYDNGLGTLEDNEITGNGRSGVVIRIGGDPVLRRNVIRDNSYDGVLVHEGGLGTLEDNEITANGTWGAEIKDSNPVLRHNQVHHNTQGGVHVLDNGLGTLEDNDITSNAYVGVEIVDGGNPTVRGNRINGNAHQGVFVHDGGKGVLEDNDLTGNTRGAWLIQKACKPNVTRARNAE
jgi:F-box protein 11